MGQLIPLFWTSRDVSSWFESLECAALFTLGRGICDVCSMIYTSGVTPAELLMASMAASHCSPHAYLKPKFPTTFSGQ